MARPKKKGNADQWAREYFGENTFQSKTTDIALKAAGIFPRNMKAGLPKKGLPQPALDGSGSWSNYELYMTSADKAYREGYGLALVHALRWHLILAKTRALPQWIRSALATGLMVWLEHRAETFDEALGVKRPQAKKEMAKTKADFSGMICIAIEKAIKADVALDAPLFSAVGDRFGLGCRAIERIYRANKGATSAGKIRRTK